MNVTVMTNVRDVQITCATISAHTTSHVNDYELTGSLADGRSTALLRRDKKAMGWPCPLTPTLSITSDFWGDGQACRKSLIPSLRNTGLISCSLPLWEVRKLYYVLASYYPCEIDFHSCLVLEFPRSSLYSLSRGWYDICTVLLKTGVSVV